jgi:pimeloyl-ACP methyl ester carboxylesterase
VVAAAVLTALVVVGGAASAGSQQPAPGVPAGLKKCKDVEAWCGSILVPLDRSGQIKGTTKIGFEYYPRTDTGRPSLGTIVAAEGGPGYSSTDSREYYLDLFTPLLDRRAMLLVDQRGTGLSNPIFCRDAQSYDGNWVANAEACGAALGRKSDLYTSAAASHDLAAVLRSLAVTEIDLYGDSYGSFFAQAFAVRYPDTVRTLVLDATYPIADLDPFYATTANRLRENLAIMCARSAATCPASPGGMVDLVERAVQRVRTRTITTTAPDYAGEEVTVVLTPRKILDVLLATDATPGWIREAPAALVALLHDNPRPLGRLVAESAFDPGEPASGPQRAGGLRSELRGYSEGAYLAYACTDYPQLWDKSSSFAARETQWAASLAAIPPATVAPWRVAEYADSDFFTYDYCIRWPAPGSPEPAFPTGGRYPDVPTLVLNGELDLRTDVYQAREVAESFPSSTYVEVPNMGHVTALYDVDQCASTIVRRFVRTEATGDVSCLAKVPEHRLVPRFAERVADAPQAVVASGADRSTAADRRAAWVAVEALGDVVDRWYAIPDITGVGLYGGEFTMDSTSGLPFISQVWSIDLDESRWTRDVAVSGSATVPRAAGTAIASLKVDGPGTAKGELTVTWSTRAAGSQARITGTIGGRAIDVSRPAPSYW